MIKILILLVLVSCTHQINAVNLKKTTFSELKGWEDDNFITALDALLKSCPKARNSKIGNKFIQRESLVKICERAKNLTNINNSQTARYFFETSFTPYKISSGNVDKGIFTGYYEPQIEGSLTKDNIYKYPLYRTPDLTSKTPYYNRKEINAGALEGKNLELLYLKDKIDAFFLHIQGSGSVKLNDGSVVRVGYAAKNGHPYNSIGKYLIDKKHIEKDKISALSIKEWLRKNPKKIDLVLQQNPSYIFFRKINTASPIGAQGVELTTNRSLAIDNKHIPYGLPIWLNTTLNESPNLSEVEFNRLMISQDTGSAIKGVVRGDIFFGNGVIAEERASFKKSHGQYYILIPNS